MLRPRGAWIVALLMACALANFGCRRHTRTSVAGSPAVFTTDSFPGGPVEDGNVADDKRGMSPSGANFDEGMILAVNEATGACIAAYSLDDGTVYVHHFDGQAWTPPVALAALELKQGTIQTFSLVVAFLNTVEHPSEAARERDGDALIFWRGVDVDQDGGGPDEENTCLFSTYFRVRDREDAGKNFGFQAEAARLNSRDGLDEEVVSTGLVSDGLKGEARWVRDMNFYRWGDATSSLFVVWHQREDSDGFPGIEDRALYFRQVVLDAAVPADQPLLPGTGIGAEIRLPIDGMGASDSGTSSPETQVESEFASYNNELMFLVSASTVGDPTMHLVDASFNLIDEWNDQDPGVDKVVEAVHFDAAGGAVSSPSLLHAFSPDATDALANVGAFPDGRAHIFSEAAGLCYGSDEGLAAIVVWNLELDEDADGNFGAANSGRIGVSEIDEATGVVLEHALVGTDDPAVDDTPVLGALQGRMGRNGDYVVAVCCQKSGDGAMDDYALLAHVYATTRIAEDGTFPAPPLLSASLSAPAPVNTDLDGSPCYYWAFQEALGYVCGIQSDPDALSVMYEHSTGAYDEIFVARLSVDTALPATLSVAVTSVDSEDDNVGWRGSSSLGDTNNAHAGWGCIDGGTAGDVVVVYDKDVVAGSGTELHLFSASTGVGASTVRIDSGIPEKQCLMGKRFRLVGTPAGTDIDSFGGDPDVRPNPLRTLHVLFHETDSILQPGIGTALRTRRFRADAGAPSFGDAWFPSAGAGFAPPTDLDLPGIATDLSDSASDFAVFRCEDTVGVYFFELHHVYYQEFDGGAGADDVGWNESAGASDPFLVDDDAPEEAEFGAEAFRRTGDCCDLPGSMVFWSKSFGPGSHLRVQVRVRDGDLGH